MNTSVSEGGMKSTLPNEESVGDFAKAVYQVIESMVGEAASIPGYPKLEIVQIGTRAYYERVDDLTCVILPITRIFGGNYIVCAQACN